MLRVPNDLKPKPAHAKHGERPPRYATYGGDVARRAAHGADRVHPDKSRTPISTRRIAVGTTTLLVYSRCARRSLLWAGRRHEFLPNRAQLLRCEQPRDRCTLRQTDGAVSDDELAQATWLEIDGGGSGTGRQHRDE